MGGEIDREACVGFFLSRWLCVAVLRGFCSDGVYGKVGGGGLSEKIFNCDRIGKVGSLFHAVTRTGRVW